MSPVTDTVEASDVLSIKLSHAMSRTDARVSKECIVDAGEVGEMCSECDREMSQGDMGWECLECGAIGGDLEAYQQTTQITLQNNQSTPCSGVADTKFRSQDDRFNLTYSSAFMRLQKQHAKKNSEFYIPLDILRETAHIYATICHSVHAGPKVADADLTYEPMTPKDTSIGEHNDAAPKKDKHRHNLILSSLLQNQLDKNGLSKTDNYICQFNGITKAKLTKSKNRLQTFIKSGAVAHVHPYDRIPSFVYLFLSKLGMDTVHTDLVVAIIRRADEQVDMIRYRTCQDNSKVVGAIWLVARQLNVKLQHPDISEKCERISKSTYMRYVDFIDVNRRRINPILVKHKVRPIPKSFAKNKEKRDPQSRTLNALPEQYVGVYQFTPDPAPKPKPPPVKRLTKKAKQLLADAAEKTESSTPLANVESPETPMSIAPESAPATPMTTSPTPTDASETHRSMTSLMQTSIAMAELVLETP
jgi:hypothetical protein